MPDKPAESASPKKRYLDKFDSDEDLARAYSELEKKLGTQGDELGQLRKQYEEAQKALQQAAEELKALKPYADWYTQNAQALQLYQQWLAQQTAQPAQPATGTTTQTPSSTRSLLDLLTPEEKQALFQESAKTFEERVFRPWQQRFQDELKRLADERAKQLTEQWQRQQQAFTEVLWRTMQRGLPEDKVKAMREWHEQALRLAQIDDPMKAADEWLSLRSRADELEQKLKALEAERDKLLKATVPSVPGAEAPWSRSTEQEKTPTTRQERFQRVLADVKERVGHDAAREYFGPRV